MSEANVKKIGEYKVDLSQRTEFWQQLIYFLKNCVSVQEPLIKSWFDVPKNQMPIFVLSVYAGK